MRPLDGSLALITGASRGIGACLAAALRRRGAEVLDISRNPSPGGVACDLASPHDRRRLIADLNAAGRPIDLLIHNAGIQRALDLTSPCDDPAQEITVNLTAPVELTAGLLPLIRKPGGSIVTLTSLLALHPKTSAPVYCASKAGLSSFTKALRSQLAPLGIHVVEVQPPLVDTDMTQGRARNPMSAERMAEAIVAGLEGGRAVIAPGLARKVRLLNRIAPGLVAASLRNS